MATSCDQIHGDRKITVKQGSDSSLNEEQKSDESVIGRYFTASSTRSPNDSRNITPETTVSSTSTTEDPEDTGFDPRNTNLDYFHGEARFDALISEGAFTKVKGLSDCCRSDGKVELHSWRASSEDLTVVVKRVVMSRIAANVGKESNERVTYRGHCQRHAEDCLNEIGVYCYLARQNDLPQYLLRMHTAFQARGDAWLVLEHANDGDLFAVSQKMKREGNNLSDSQLMTWTWQLLQAVHYLHKHGIGHRDISMENVLLCNGSVRLMDFGQSVRTHSAGNELLRYFNPLGKPYYRPPECYSPVQSSVDVHVPPGARPGQVAFVRTVTGDTLCEVLLPLTAVPGQICAAEPWGYAVAPVDIFACGVCIFNLTTGRPPWRQANLSCQNFVWVYQYGISQLLKALQKAMPAAAEELMKAMVQFDPTRRPSAEQCLSHRWLQALCGAEVPVHPMCCRDSTPSSVDFASSGEAPADTGMSMLGFPATAGDPYRNDAVVRSVAAESLTVEVPCSAAAFGGVFAGDFYHVADDTCCRSAGVAPEELTLQRFSVGDLPAKTPTSESFAFEPTTFTVAGKEPAELANNLLDFLTMGAGAVVKKVNSKKFTIKAEFNGEDGACTLKVRVYDQGEGNYSVELQRRDGDSTAFHKIFDQLSHNFATPAEPSQCTEKKDTNKVADSGKADTSPAACKDRRQPCPSPPLITRSRGHAGIKGQRRPVSTTATRAKTSTTGSCKIATAEAIESITSERTNPAGSGLNAVRWRSKSTIRHPPKAQLSAALQGNSTM